MLQKETTNQIHEHQCTGLEPSVEQIMYSGTKVVYLVHTHEKSVRLF